MTSPNAKWIRVVLLAAAAYNIIWGVSVVLFPSLIFRWLGMEQPNYPEIWQCLGMIVGVYGLGYGIAAFDPMRHWPIVFVGLLGKLLGPIGLLQAATQGPLPWRFGLLNVTNDLIWLAPFAIILWNAYRFHSSEQNFH